MKHINRRQFLWGSAGVLTGLSAGCGSGRSLPDSLEGYLVLLADNNSRLILARPDGSAQHTLLKEYLLSLVSPDRKVLVLKGLSGSRITLWTKESSVLLPLDPHAGSPIDPLAWSPDSQRLLLGYGRELGGLAVSHIATPEGNVQTIERFPQDRYVHSAGWLDNQHLTYEGVEGTFRFNLEDGKEEKLSEKRFHTPSPDGRFLLRHDLITQGLFLERLNTQTGAVDTLLDSLSVLNPDYSWSSDGQYLLLSGNRGLSPLAFRIHASNQTIEEISLAPLVGAAPSVLWSPDSQSFAYFLQKQFGVIRDDDPTFLEIRGAVGTFTLPGYGLPSAWL